MKRIIIVTLMLVVASLAFSVEYVEDMDGGDWVQFSYEQKLGYVQGFYSAYSSFWERLATEIGETDEEDEYFMTELFYIEINVGPMIEEIDNYYDRNIKTNRAHKLYQV